MELSRQFDLMRKNGEMGKSSSQTHILRKVDIEHLKPGTFARPTWAKTMPFREVAGRSLHDPSHPADTTHLDLDESDPDYAKMYTPDYGRSFGPHVSNGTPFYVLVPR